MSNNRTENRQNVSSVFRKGSVHASETYRPFFLTSALSKLAVKFLTTVKNMIIWIITQPWVKKKLKIFHNLKHCLNIKYPSVLSKRIKLTWISDSEIYSKK